LANILGIIAEYNPLHNGHMYHIQKAKELTQADYVVAVISGNFTQRGLPAIINKWEKTKMALEAGIDLVIELPTLYSISSAENFADGAVKVLKELGFVTHISFGMEAEDLSELNNIANVLVEEPEGYVDTLKSELKKGISYPKARQIAIEEYFNDKAYGKLLSGSNNILAIEYLKAIKKQKAEIIPVGIKREKVFYNSKKIIDEFASSTGIRSLMIHNEFDAISKVVPSKTFNVLLENIKSGTYIKGLSSFENIIIYKLRTMNKSEIANLPEVSEGLENLIKTAVTTTNSIDTLIAKIKSKRYTKTKIQRILLYTLLDITKQDMEIAEKIVPYVRVLAASKQGKKLLPNINPKTKVITSVKKFETENKNRRLGRMLNIDKQASDIYTIGYKKESKAGLDYTNGLMIKWQILQNVYNYIKFS